jgi:hypothetical protein
MRAAVQLVLTVARVALGGHGRGDARNLRQRIDGTSLLRQQPARASTPDRPRDPLALAHPPGDFLQGVENSMHWVLDMAFGEDQCRVRVENAAQNFAILRRISMNLLKRDTTTKVGLKNRRLMACANDQYRAALLAL